MICILNPHTDPAFNLAAEEYLLKAFDRDIFRLWRNDNAIIVGKHQNTLSEINAGYVKEKGVQVIRRLSGGGAVFHDLGNLNFTFIMHAEGEKQIDFRKYTLPILEVMQQLEIPARFEGRNDLTINGMKFSGNAEHIWKNRVLHHGTLLFSSELNDLSSALQVRPDKFNHKGVKSVRSRVTNISSHLKAPISVMEFAHRIMQHIEGMYPQAEAYEFTDKDIVAIEQLKEEKYSTWEWNYGYSPDYNFHQEVQSKGGHIELLMQVHRGIIREAVFYGDFFNQRDPQDLASRFVGLRHDMAALQTVIRDITVSDYFTGATSDDLMALLF
jgi:lipoate---protein ligase